jgi:phenylalanyl-tRNA synthetase beta chain
LKLLVSWLRDFVDVEAPVSEIASTLSMCGFEVASVDPVEGGPAVSAPGSDGVIDFEVTANRPDCLSVIGLAREAATAFRLPLRLPWDAAGRPASTVRPVAAPTESRLSAGGVTVSIEDADLCPRYAAAVAEVKIGPSPAWLASRLTAAGVRPINNVVDVTNYVLLEMGHPMHAFDLDRLAGRELCARPARAGEQIVTLDGEKRELAAGMLVIADAAKPQAVAGVMGGSTSEVWNGTRTVVFESAYFKPASVRRTSKRLGLKTEASSRFERGTDINAAVVAIERACALLEQIGAGQRRGEILDCYPAPRGPITVALRRARIPHLLGVPVPDADVCRILAGLGFETTDTAEGWVARVPTHRVDVQREVDLLEELARHHGYDKVPATFPPLHAMPARPDPGIARRNLLRHVLTAGGFSEAIDFAFIEAAAARPFAPSEGEVENLVPLAYPLSEKFAVLRPSLLPGLVDAVAHNRHHDRADVRLFEIGNAFTSTGGEQARLAEQPGLGVAAALLQQGLAVAQLALGGPQLERALGAAEQLVRIERLAQVVDRSQSEGPHLLGHSPVGGEQNDRNFGGVGRRLEGHRGIEASVPLAGRTLRGRLTVTLSLELVDRLTFTQSRLAVSVAILAVLFAALIAVLVADRVVGRPLSSLVSAME